MVFFLAACGPKTSEAPGSGTSDRGSTQLYDADEFDERWEHGMRVGDGRRAGPGQSEGRRSSGAVDQQARWAVVLATSAGDDHEAICQAILARIVQQFPQLQGCYIAPVGQGSAVLYGRFQGPREPEAGETLKWIKSIQVNGVPVFPTAMLSRHKRQAEPPRANDLRTLRARYPQVEPLYTLQVAAWSDFDGESLQVDSLRTQAEAYTRELRLKGYEAYYYHDVDSDTSVVTIGAFDDRAYDPRSMLVSPDVQLLMNQFPAHKVNGEELLVLVNPRNPDGPRRPQSCRLVLVP